MAEVVEVSVEAEVVEVSVEAAECAEVSAEDSEAK